MPHVLVHPMEIQLEVRVGETAFDAARRLGYRWPTLCGGQGTCTTCHMMVNEGVTNLSEITAYETEGLSRVLPRGKGGTFRLACQAKVLGDVAVTKRGVRPLAPRTDAQGTAGPVGPAPTY